MQSIERPNALTEPMTHQKGEGLNGRIYREVDFITAHTKTGFELTVIAAKDISEFISILKMPRADPRNRSNLPSRSRKRAT